MKFMQVTLSLSLLLLFPFLVVESSSSADNTFFSNITRGSSLSTHDPNPYWLSPSGNIAFGFYRLPCTDSCSSPNWRDRYVVGIWFTKSPQQTLLWTANPNDPLNKPSSILFTNDGKLVVRIMPDNKDKILLPDVAEPALYAKMHDDGNFVLYGSDSQIVWESFDHATDTILGGQKLKAGSDLISGSYRLSARQNDGLVAVYQLQELQTWNIYKKVSDAIRGLVNTPVALNLDPTGNLYLAGSDDAVLKYLYRNKNNNRKEEGSTVKEDGVYIHRATLSSEGIFNLYKERVDGSITSTDHDEKSSSVPVRLWQNDQVNHGDVLFIIILFGTIDGIGILCFIICVIERCRERRRMKAEKERTAGGDIESGKTCPVVRESFWNIWPIYWDKTKSEAKLASQSRRKKAAKKRTSRGEYMELEKLES